MLGHNLWFFVPFENHLTERCALLAKGLGITYILAIDTGGLVKQFLASLKWIKLSWFLLQMNIFVQTSKVKIMTDSIAKEDIIFKSLYMYRCVTPKLCYPQFLEQNLPIWITCRLRPWRYLKSTWDLWLNFLVKGVGRCLTCKGLGM